jgi:cardiolipin synthase
MSRKTSVILVVLITVVFAGVFHTFGVSTQQLIASPFSQTQTQKYHTVPQIPLTLITLPQEGIQQVLNQIQTASSSIDLIMYELADPEVEKALIERHQQGLSTRVLLNGGYYGQRTMNTKAFNELSHSGVPVRYTAGTFALTHQKTLITDKSTLLVMTFNLIPKYYATGRDFGIVTTDVADVSAAERTFDADWNAQPIDPPWGDSLVWSPGAKNVLVGIIDSATSTLKVYNEEMQDPDIIRALIRASDRGVVVAIVMTDANQWHMAFVELSAHNVSIFTYARKAPLYIHAKMILADDREAFVGSENFSTNSLDKNRELGMLISTPVILDAIKSTFIFDRESATLYTNQLK